MDNDNYQMRDEYKPEDFPGGFVRGKYAERYHAQAISVVLDPDVAQMFPNAQAVNTALRGLMQLVRATTQHEVSAK